MCIVVTKSPPEIVRPSEPVTTTAATGKIIFSPFDKPLATVPVVVLQVFEHPIHEPVETIRRGLSQALVHYYPLAGRLAGDDYDDVHIDCTGEGVTFVAASANCTVKQLMRDIDGRLPDPSTAVQRELIVDDNPAYGFGRADPLILMQVTTFTCGGFVVGVTWNHGAADGFGIAQFLQAVGELARGLPTTSVIPVRSDKSLQAMSSSTVMAAKQFMFGVKPTTLALHSITIPARVINGVRGPTPTCTVFEAVAAVMWRCRTRVVMSDPDAPTVLAITVNTRRYMGVEDGYYGNCATVQMAVARSGVVADGDMMEVVRTIRRAKEEIPERLKKGDAIAELSKGQLGGYESVLLVTCWRNIGFEAVDFGGGRTARVMTTYEQSGVRPLCVVCLPWQGEEEEGARVLSGCSPPQIVRPSEPVTTAAANGKIILSPLDRPFAILPEVVLQVFEHPIHEPVETIRRGLSRALLHYYPLAGHLAAGEGNDDVHIDCTGEGVTFVAASANCTIKQLMLDIDGRSPDAATAVQRELIVDYPANGFGRADPLVLMQVTAFACGGFVVGVTWNHGAADGFGIAQFLQAVGELARGLPTTSVIPVRCDESIQAMSLPPSLLMVAKQFMYGAKPPTKLALHSITIPSRMINGIRGPSCTVFEAVAAALWRCRTRVVMSDPDAPTVLAITVNSRKYIGVKDGYYGNCITAHMAVARSGAVAGGDMMEVVRAIRRAKEEIPERLKKGDVIGDLTTEQVTGYEGVLLVTCWRNIGFEAVDFGGGRTARVMTTYEQSGVRPMCVVCLPWQGEEDEGARVLSSCVTAHHADAFLREIATL
uniref:Uncharacterized protein n=1 Tax=Oryza rufipogon TaxID=4529 RepID=A0A0E0QVS7_ORYRU